MRTGFSLQVLGELRPGVAAEQRVHARELAPRALQREGLGAQPRRLEALLDRRQRLVRADRVDDLGERLGLALSDAPERPFHVQTAERGRDRPFVSVLRPGRQEDEDERDGHQDVPLPPRRVPAPGDDDRQGGLGQEDERCGDGERQWSATTTAVIARYRTAANA